METIKAIKLIVGIVIICVASILGCDNNDPSPGANPKVIPVQTTEHTTVNMAGSTNLVVLAGAAITNTGATNITGDLGLSPGTSIGGFPPGILNGTQHINDVTANQAKLDLTAAYNDAAGRTSTDIVTLSGNIGGLTLTPGLYKSTSSWLYHLEI